MEKIEFDDIKKFEDEEWKELKTPLYPNIRNDYMISNYGRIYSNRSKKILRNSLKANGYYQVSLMVNYGEDSIISLSKLFSIHRLLMAVFNPIDIEDMKKMEVNHKDCNKLNNKLDNLEWATPKENTIHAFQNGLVNVRFGESHPDATLTDEEVRKICELWISGDYDHEDIADIICTKKSTVAAIVSGASWKHITKDYDFNKKEVSKKPKYLTTNEIHKVCKYFEEHPKPSDQSERQYLISLVKNKKFQKYSEDKLDYFVDSIRKIYKRKNYIRISSQYVF